MNFTKEQLDIINNISEYNIIVNAVAGSGKTTTSIGIAQKYKNKKVLLLVYNNRLRHETLEKCKNKKLNNIVVHTYHSFCHNYGSNEVIDDISMKYYLDIDVNFIKKDNFDIFIVDEVQDCTKLYHNLIEKIYKEFSNPESKICILGDKLQCIYQYLGSNYEFLTEADKFFNFNNTKFIRCSLSQSFRLGIHATKFVNHILNKPYMNSTKIDEKPTYIIENLFDMTLFKYIYEIIQVNGPENVFIIAPSVKNTKSPIVKLENYLCKLGVPIYCPLHDGNLNNNANITLKKVIFCTYNQTKGLERNIVICYGIDSSYFKYYGRDIDNNVCPNIMYVACTRAVKKMYILHSKDHNYLNFVDKNLLPELVDYQMLKSLNTNLDKNNVLDKNSFFVTDIVKHLPLEIMHECLSLIKLIKINNRSQDITNDNIIQFKQHNGVILYEDVSVIKGLFFPLYYHYRNKKVLNKNNFVDLILKKLCKDSGYMFMGSQITDFDFITDKEIEKIISFFEKYIGSDYITELPVQKIIKNTQIYGRIDFVTNDYIYEIKHTNNISSEHILQTVIYSWLYNDVSDTKKCRILNSLTFEILELEIANIDAIINTLLFYKKN